MTWRLALFKLIFFCSWLGLGAQLSFIHFGKNPKLDQWAQSQKHSTKIIPAKRGSIYDRNGKVLAMDIPTVSFFADPKFITDKKQFTEQLKKIGWNSKRVQDGLNRKNNRFVWVKRKLKIDTGLVSQAKKITGLFTLKEYKRIYPQQELLAHTLGIIGQGGEGLEGLERQYNKILKAQPRKIQFLKDARSRPLKLDSLKQFQTPTGKNIHLTIDASIQALLEEELNKQHLYENAKHTYGIVVDVQKGEVLALAQTPSVNLNTKDARKIGRIKNKLITEAFEPGSIQKFSHTP